MVDSLKQQNKFDIIAITEIEYVFHRLCTESAALEIEKILFYNYQLHKHQGDSGALIHNHDNNMMLIQALRRAKTLNTSSSSPSGMPDVCPSAGSTDLC